MSSSDLKKKKSKSQKIIIPKGSINPNEETVIEIPPSMRRRAVVVAKRDMSSAGVMKRRQTGKSTVVHKSTITPGFREERRRRYDQEESRNSQPGSSGLSHAGHVEFANDEDIERLLDDLERYYCSQRQLLVRAKLSRVSMCSCGAIQPLECQACGATQTAFPCDTSGSQSQMQHSSRDDDDRDNRSKPETFNPKRDNSYEQFKSCLSDAKTSEQKYNRSTAQATRSAPQTQISTGRLDYAQPNQTGSSSFRQPAQPNQTGSSSFRQPAQPNQTGSSSFRQPAQPNQTGSSSFRQPAPHSETRPFSCRQMPPSAPCGTPTCPFKASPICSRIPSKERNYEKLLNSKKLFSICAEELRLKLNELEPGACESKKEFKAKSEILRKKLKELLEEENKQIDLSVLNDETSDEEIQQYMFENSSEDLEDNSGSEG